MLKEEVFTPEVITKKVRSGLGNGRGTLLLAIAGIAVSICSSFMFCLASIGFDFSELQQSVFWSRWASMSVSSLIAYIFVILHKDETNRLKEWYVTNMKKIAEKSEAAGEEFEVFLRDLNIRRQVEWYKRKMGEKVAQLNHALLKAEIHHKPTEEIQARIKLYSERMSDEFILSHREVLKTRSKPIYSAQVLTEAQKGDAGEANFRSASAYYGSKAFVKTILSLGMTAAFSCVVVQNFEAGINIASVVMTVLTVLSIFISVWSAIMAANGCYKNVYVPNLLFKLKILSDFEKWKANKGQLGA